MLNAYFKTILCCGWLLSKQLYCNGKGKRNQKENYYSVSPIVIKVLSIAKWQSDAEIKRHLKPDQPFFSVTAIAAIT